MWVFFTRGAAVQCHDNQEGVDIVIPVVLDSAKPLGRYNMSAILLQVKNRRTGTKVNIDAEHKSTQLFTDSDARDSSHSGRPYIAILLDIGVGRRRAGAGHLFGTFKHRNGTSNPTPASTFRPVSDDDQTTDVRSTSIAGVPPVKRSMRRTQLHPRYSIHAAGHPHNVFPFLGEESDELLASMLNAREWHEDITRSDADVLGVLNGMKPVWSYRLGSFKPESRNPHLSPTVG